MCTFTRAPLPVADFAKTTPPGGPSSEASESATRVAALSSASVAAAAASPPTMRSLLVLLAGAAALQPPQRQRTRCASVVRAAAEPISGPGIAPPRNVKGGDLQCCCAEVRDTGIGTGFYRDGHCSTGADDAGRHTVCIEATAEFLTFSAAVGNDLSTPMPEYMFPGLQPGDKWCLCAQRWEQARVADSAPRVHLRATHENTLEHCDLADLEAFAVDLEECKEDDARVDDLRAQMMKTAGLA